MEIVNTFTPSLLAIIYNNKEIIRFVRFSIRLLIVISAVILCLSTADATINIDYVGPGSGNLDYGFTGDTLYGQVNCNEPYGIVYWYLKGPGDTGMGTIVSTDYGDGVSTGAYFSHTFNNGSTSGEEYEITAYVYPDPNAADQRVDWDSFTVNIWTPVDQVITTPDELTITDDIKLGDYYTFTAEASSSENNYVIEDMEVFVNGVSVQFRSFSVDETVSISISGFLPASTATQLEVVIQLGGTLKKGAQEVGKAAAKAAAKWGAKKTYTGLLTGTIEGYATCWHEGNALDNNQHNGFSCMESGVEVFDSRRNYTRVKWTTTDYVGARWTSSNGYYLFDDDVPMGHHITLWIRGDDLHEHWDPLTQSEDEKQKLICKYEDNTNIGQIGEVVLSLIPRGKRIKGYNLNLKPVATYDPCDNKYPVTYTDLPWDPW